MIDDEFLAAFEDTTLEPFHHRDHVRVTFLYVRAFGERGTRERLGAAILRYADARNGGAKYHETITQAWIGLVAARSDVGSFEAMLAAHPELLDKDLLNRYYSAERLQSAEARARWVEPDLRALN
jgi:hypothetical protein